MILHLIFLFSALSNETRTYPRNVFARPIKPVPFKLPKRLRLVYFVARTRLVQRLLMVVLMVWISLLVYNSGIVEHLNNEGKNSNIYDEAESDVALASNNGGGSLVTKIPVTKTHSAKYESTDKSIFRLKHPNLEIWKLLSSQHWSALFGYYNISLYGRYISILPPIHLSIPVDPSEAISLRHPSESDPQIFRQFLSPSGVHSPHDPDDETDQILYGPNSQSFHVPWTSTELFIALALSIPSIIFIAYLIVLMYRCFCTRNYAEWRDSWANTLRMKKNPLEGSHRHGHYSEYLTTETLPLKLPEHEQELEYIASNTDTPFVVSCCMQGDIKVWDVLSGECHTHIIRNVQPSPTKAQASVQPSSSKQKTPFKPHHKSSGSFSSDSTYGSSPSNGSGDLSFETSSPVPETPNNSSVSQTTPSRIQQQTSTDSNLGYNFSPYYSQWRTSQNVLTDFIVNAAINSEHSPQHECQANVKREASLPHMSVWCIELQGKQIIIGCSNGRLEIWNALNGELYYVNDDNPNGITVVKATKSKLIVARLDGVLEIYQVEYTNGFTLDAVTPTSFTGESSHPQPAHSQMIRYNLMHSFRAHLQPITALEIETIHIITGSLDHNLKVYRFDTANCVFKLNGHCGGITAIHVDQVTFRAPKIVEIDYLIRVAFKNYDNTVKNLELHV